MCNDNIHTHVDQHVQPFVINYNMYNLILFDENNGCDCFDNDDDDDDDDDTSTTL